MENTVLYFLKLSSRLTLPAKWNFLEHTKRQVHKWKFLQHALSRYVYNRNLFAIFTQAEMAEE